MGLAFKKLTDDGWNAIIEGAQGMAQRVQEEKPEVLYCRTISEMLTQKKILLRHRDGGMPLGGDDSRAEMVGWYDADRFYLLPDAAYNLVSRYYRDQGNVFPVRESTLRKSLHESGALVLKDGRRAASEYLEGKTQRVLIPKRTAFEGWGKPEPENKSPAEEN